MTSLFSRFAPQFTELYLYSVAYSLLLIIAYFWKDLLSIEMLIVYSMTQTKMLAILCFLSLYILLVIYHVFSTRKKIFLEKRILAFITIGIIVSMVFSLFEIKNTVLGAILMAWNMAYAFWLVIVFKYISDIEPEMFHSIVPDEADNTRYVLPFTVTIFVLFVVFALLFQYSYVITFASLIALSVPVGHTIMRFSFAKSTHNPLFLISIIVLIVVFVGSVGLLT